MTYQYLTWMKYLRIVDFAKYLVFVYSQMENTFIAIF